MMGIWVDTDLGFDDLWALLVLRALDCPVAGVSLVAGNSPLSQVAENARRAKAAYHFKWPVWLGARGPLYRPLQTAEAVLGPTGMRSRGTVLPETSAPFPDEGAIDAMEAWLLEGDSRSRQILALGPLTNLALLVQRNDGLTERISRLVWMGGSRGAGNQTPLAEFNAVVDADALSIVTQSGIPMDIVDLVFCREHAFGCSDMPICDPLTGDLLGGYLDIARERGRDRMAIYDPLAALAIGAPDCINFANFDVNVSTRQDDTYGATQMVETTKATPIRVAKTAAADLVMVALNALRQETVDGSRV